MSLALFHPNLSPPQFPHPSQLTAISAWSSSCSKCSGLVHGPFLPHCLSPCTGSYRLWLFIPHWPLLPLSIDLPPGPCHLTLNSPQTKQPFFPELLLSSALPQGVMPSVTKAMSPSNPFSPPYFLTMLLFLFPSLPSFLYSFFPLFPSFFLFLSFSFSSSLLIGI